MDIYQLKFTTLQLRILRLLCIKSEKSLNQRNISKILKVSPTAVSKSIEKIEKEQLVKTEKDKSTNILAIRLLRENPKVIQMKRIENLNLLNISGLIEYLEENFPSCTIILFGSYSNGEDTTNSDIDIAVIGAKQKTLDLHKFEISLERKIIIQNYTNLKEINKELKQSILNGIRLSGVIEL